MLEKLPEDQPVEIGGEVPVPLLPNLTLILHVGSGFRSVIFIFLFSAMGVD
jgi:hypothetical protein